MRAKARINKQGRLVIPAACREAAEIRPGDDVVIEAIGQGELRLRTKQQAIRSAQSIVARRLPGKRDLVAELIAERRKAAAVE